MSCKQFAKMPVFVIAKLLYGIQESKITDQLIGRSCFMMNYFFYHAPDFRFVDVMSNFLNVDNSPEKHKKLNGIFDFFPNHAQGVFEI